jgi:hypothetical protein
MVMMKSHVAVNKSGTVYTAAFQAKPVLKFVLIVYPFKLSTRDTRLSRAFPIFFQIYGFQAI